jgi:hypothetical protein
MSLKDQNKFTSMRIIGEVKGESVASLLVGESSDLSKSTLKR